MERTGLEPLPNKSVTIRSEHVIVAIGGQRPPPHRPGGEYLASFKDVPLQAYRSSPEATTAEMLTRTLLLFPWHPELGSLFYSHTRQFGGF